MPSSPRLIHRAHGPSSAAWRHHLASTTSCVASLAEVYAELDRRAEVIDGRLPRHQAPEFEITPKRAARHDLSLRPVVMAIDECPDLFADDKYGDNAAKYPRDHQARPRRPHHPHPGHPSPCQEQVRERRHPDRPWHHGPHSDIL